MSANNYSFSHEDIFHIIVIVFYKMVNSYLFNHFNSAIFSNKGTQLKKEVGVPNLPLMDPSPFIPQGYSDCSVFAEVEVVAIVMVVRSNPANPHTSRVLTGKDPH